MMFCQLYCADDLGPFMCYNKYESKKHSILQIDISMYLNKQSFCFPVPKEDKLALGKNKDLLSTTVELLFGRQKYENSVAISFALNYTLIAEIFKVPLSRA